MFLRFGTRSTFAFVMADGSIVIENCRAKARIVGVGTTAPVEFGFDGVRVQSFSVAQCLQTRHPTSRHRFPHQATLQFVDWGAPALCQKPKPKALSMTHLFSEPSNILNNATGA
jgi:hypothetical protein